MKILFIGLLFSMSSFAKIYDSCMISRGYNGYGKPKSYIVEDSITQRIIAEFMHLTGDSKEAIISERQAYQMANQEIRILLLEKRCQID